MIENSKPIEEMTAFEKMSTNDAIIWAGALIAAAVHGIATGSKLSYLADEAGYLYKDLKSKTER